MLLVGRENCTIIRCTLEISVTLTVILVKHVNLGEEVYVRRT